MAFACPSYRARVHAKPRQATRCPIPARSFVIRFPDGDFEYDLTRNDYPEVGDTLRRRGSLWSVTGIEGDVQFTVHVAPADGEDAQREVISSAEQVLGRRRQSHRGRPCS
jgi:hypothetical protein